MNPLICQLIQVVELPQDLQFEINSATTYRQLAKNVRIISSGNTCHEMHFLASGLARVFYYKDGKDVTAWFSAENQIVNAVDSLIMGTPTFYNIELLEDSEVYSVPLQKIQQIFFKYPAIQKLGLLLLTKRYLTMDERIKSFASCRAEERYEKLVQQLPDIFNRVKLGHIASYIGITQEHLSRLRGNYKLQSKKRV